ncbi:unnamed protein product [Adineta steineri]|uniref:Uncharacterized protein n=1 Tax=Adineta steineri TaxID=433720 RepID=A0A814JBB9_9BILA|nr:unnamed protein product [Adineta steineri]CAF1028818.1 unnamed protein product [Adineta steineri]CAF1033301.1 unnamed protein product [Adineta steineri]CAF3513323.1 unnamed protein product [Adineta steineri]CAF3594799.1 unnamed protein product [Adineta steineri]
MKNSLKLSRYNTRYHHDYQDTFFNDDAEIKYSSICAGCNGPIYDQYLLKVAPDLEWHIQCLKCSECGQYLDESATCFVLDGKPFCKYDYIRLFASKCTKCHESFSKNELFIRTACYRRYHPDCFRCDHCDRLLASGDEYYLHEQNQILCRQDFHQLNLSNQSIGTSTAATNNNSIPLRPPPTSSSSSTTSSSSNQPLGSIISSTSNLKSTNNNIRKDKTTRMRTVLNEKQLLTLRTCYGANPRPDAIMKEQLVDMTQLSPRVIRVWFQNKRCKDKKRSILAKQTQEQQKVLTSLNHSIPLIARSPVPNDINIGLSSPSLIQVQYHSGGPWKTINSYSNGHHLQVQQQNFHDITGFASEDDSTCFDTSQFSEERSDTSCDGSGASQLTLL